MNECDDYFDRLVNQERLQTFLEESLGQANAFEVERHVGGQSNETLFVTWGDRDLVLRRPPPGETADTAHDVLREYTVMDALQDTPVRVPETVISAEDHDIIGSDFYLMEREHGVVVRDEEPNLLAEPSHRSNVGSELIETLVEIHDVEYEAIGLADFGYPEGFTQRQVDRWESQYEWAFEVTSNERPVPAIHEMTAWLHENVPSEYPHTLVHGDYKLDNVMLGTQQLPEIVSIFDWELSTLGDPFTDLGWLLAFWPETGAETEIFGSPGGREFQLQNGYDSRDDLIERYEAMTGYTFENERFYRALAVYKIGALSEMFYRRYLEGNADNETYPMMEQRTLTLADWAQRIIDGDDFE
ncbi:Predicted kinase, aminoglycoside phosphotransferase (APT) family [Natronorubrum sediminis]|uniref:Predicted kinase, aminoglycoside phosphotransferase (APT) family n=1 Tax=Natronorubrum sediminis TaxID=640943 RepID=A0A1H6G6S1_9EURY|nr:phosphotransferase family protein [Natronorubrum sediminis]SEH18148.1 Predicted kinase, aminoglycoside phosphotransferase (APT) family [Natronorubrum sediminis]